MENCLITKLKGYVDNENLVKFGSGILIINSSNNFALGFSNTTVRIIGDGYMSKTQGFEEKYKELTFPLLDPDHYQGMAYFTAGNYKLEVSGKYSSDIGITMTYGYVPSFEDSLKNWYFYAIRAAAGSYNISDINENTRIVVLYYTNLTGNLYDFKDGIEVLNIKQTNVTGNLNDLSRCINLREINIESTNVTGSIESFAQNVYNNGKINGLIKVFPGNTQITYSGHLIGSGIEYDLYYNPSISGGYQITEVLPET